MNLQHRSHSTDSTSTSADLSGPSTWGGVPVVGLALLAFALMRLPVLLHAPGGQDEEWYGVPGLTIADEGVPRVPYSRARDPGSVFQGADEMLFAQPPLSFYAQAPFFLALPGTYATSRLASYLAGCLSILLTYAIAHSLTHDTRIASWAAVLYSLSRLCFFPALVARPDMICGTLGLAAVLMMLWWREESHYRWLVTAGVAVGLAALTHPFAIVFGIQITVWAALEPGTYVNRIKRLAVVSVSIVLTFSLWLPLIWQRPDLFQSQFVGNILRPSGPGLLSRAIMPWDSFANQIPQLIERANPIQFAMLVWGLLLSVWWGWRNRFQGLLLGWALTISSIYLLVVCLGIHPIQGFWCYTASLGWVCFASCVVWLLDLVDRTSTVGRVAPWMVGVCLFALMIPGSGFRATVAYMRHWNDTDYASSHFIQDVLTDLPLDASITAGPEFALDVYSSGRKVILACRHPMYFDSTKYPTQYYLFGRRDFAEGFPNGYDCKLVRRYGRRDDIFANYVEVYERTKEDEGANVE